MRIDFSPILTGAWGLILLLYVVVLSGPKLPPSEGYRVPVYYGSPAPLSYNERFSPACVGPPPDYQASVPYGIGSWNDYNNDNEPLRGAPAKGCPVALAAVEAHGVGE